MYVKPPEISSQLIRYGSDKKRCWVTFVADSTTLDRQMDLANFTRIRELNNAKEEGPGLKEIQKRFDEVSA